MWTILFLILAGISNSIMDIVRVRFDISIFSKIKNKKIYNWFDFKNSWKNKWKNDDYKQGEKYLGSSTIFVFLTDAWHFFQLLMILFFILGIITHETIINNFIDIIIYITTFSISFELCWRKFFMKNE